jgi:hypothetical protein
MLQRDAHGRFQHLALLSLLYASMVLIFQDRHVVSSGVVQVHLQYSVDCSSSEYLSEGTRNAP